MGSSPISSFIPAGGRDKRCDSALHVYRLCLCFRVIVGLLTCCDRDLTDGVCSELASGEGLHVWFVELHVG